MIDALKDTFGASLFEATGGGGHVQLLTDGENIYGRTDRGEFYNLLESPAQPMLVVGNEGLLKELGGKVRENDYRILPVKAGDKYPAQLETSSDASGVARRWVGFVVYRPRSRSCRVNTMVMSS